MKILIAGDWHSDLHEEPVYRAFQKLGHEARRFAWHEYFRIRSGGRMPNIFDTVNCKFQNKYMVGPRITKLNRDLIAKANEYHPDLLFIYRGTHITRDTLRAIKHSKPKTVLVGYNNDDPFSKAYSWWKWRHFLKAVPEYDLVLAYRQHNLREFEHAGAKQVRLLRSWFVPERNHPVSLSAGDRARFECDVVFVGHYEPDGRLELLESIVKQGFRLRLFGPGRGYRWQGWYPWIEKSTILKHLAPIKLIQGEDYNKALCGAKVALCFLSKLNRDTYTRRCFEIPATGTFMLSEYSNDLVTLYREGVEADYFRNPDELICKLRQYLNDDQLRKKVAQAGYQRVLTDGHDVVSRMKQVLKWVAPMLQGEVANG
ncbi:MAG: glycosyltransferase [Kiritimatiellae bacterium]|nr:glycosyltransferase [Kiritimatiellia bacterium]